MNREPVACEQLGSSEIVSDEDGREKTTVCGCRDMPLNVAASCSSQMSAEKMPLSMMQHQRRCRSICNTIKGSSSFPSSEEVYDMRNDTESDSSINSMNRIIDPYCREVHLFSGGMGVDYFTASELPHQTMRHYTLPPFLDSNPDKDCGNRTSYTGGVAHHLSDPPQLESEKLHSRTTSPAFVCSAYTQTLISCQGGDVAESPPISFSSSKGKKTMTRLRVPASSMEYLSRTCIAPWNTDLTSQASCNETLLVRPISCPCCQESLKLFLADRNEEEGDTECSPHAIGLMDRSSDVDESCATREMWLDSNQEKHSELRQWAMFPSLRQREQQQGQHRHQRVQEQPAAFVGISEEDSNPIFRQDTVLFSRDARHDRSQHQQQQQVDGEREGNSHVLAGASLFPSLPTFSPTSFVRAYVGEGSYPWEATLNNVPALIVSCCVAIMNIVVVQFLQYHVLDTRDHLGLFVVGTYMMFATYYMTYYFLERYSVSFRRISQEKKFYTIANLIKAGILVSLVPFATLHLSKIILFDVWDTNTLRNLGCIYTIPDFVSMIVVKRMSWSTWTHHLCVLFFNFFSIMNDYGQENVCRCIVVYAAFSTFAYCVNVLLASRFLGVPPNVARVLSYIAVVVYIFFCATNWVWQVYYLRKLLRDGHDHWTVYAYMLLICLVMYDDITLNKWLLHNARSSAFAAAQHQQHQLWHHQQQKRR